jgi:5-methylcytosine-specific restriction endonuclease McrA
MKPEEREALRSRFDFRCGYCGVREADAGAELTVDHFQPRSRSGADDPTNWVYCCFTCNTHKSDVWAPVQRIGSCTRWMTISRRTWRSVQRGHFPV